MSFMDFCSRMACIQGTICSTSANVRKFRKSVGSHRELSAESARNVRFMGDPRQRFSSTVAIKAGPESDIFGLESDILEHVVPDPHS